MPTHQCQDWYIVIQTGCSCWSPRNVPVTAAIAPVPGLWATRPNLFHPKTSKPSWTTCAGTPQVRDVLLSGGDPLTLAPKVLERLLTALREIPILRSSASALASRCSCPSVSPDELCDMLQRFHPLWLNIHVNHPNEITAELAAGLR
jgi:L-lysine 2,3-aminomutase